MLNRLMTVWQKVRSSLWAVPLAMIVFAIVLAVTAGNIRLDIQLDSDPVWFLYSGGAENAPQFLSHLVSSMITMATLAISITMVVLTLAAQQLGPRLILNFMRDWHTQAALGLFVATVIYLLLVLRSSYGLEDNTPNLAVTIGTALVFTSIIVLLIFVHHLASSIIADNVAQRIGSVLDGEIHRLLPEKADVLPPERPQGIRGFGTPVRIPAGGYVQAIDFNRLFRIACAADLAVELDVRPGHHVIAHGVIGWVSTDAPAKKSIHADVARCVMIGSDRTPVQDLEFSIRHLVEIAVRALSPGINDPYTAMAVIDRLSLSIGLVMERGPAKDIWRDEQNTTRIIAPISTFEGIIDAAFNQIRQRAANSTDVLIKLAEKLVQLMALADPQQRAALAGHLAQVVDVGRRNIEDERDLRALEERAAAARTGDGENATAVPAQAPDARA